MKINTELLQMIKDDYKERGELSICYIMRKFKISPNLAKESYDQINPVSRIKIKNGYRKLASKLITQMFSMS